MSTHVDSKVQYDDFAPNYVSMEQLPSEIVAANLFRNTVTEFPTGLRVLDLACGTGTYARVLLEHGIAEHVIGVDISSEMVRVGRQIEAKQRPDAERIEFHVADCATALDELGLGLEPNSFDLVMGNWLFNYAANQMQLAAMWRNVATYLKPGGKFVGLMPIFDVQKHVYRSPWNGVTFEEIGTVLDGVKVHITAHCSPQIEFDNFLLNCKLHEEVPVEMGMKDIVYSLPTEADLPSWDGLKDAGKWKEYLENPVSQICTAIKALE